MTAEQFVYWIKGYMSAQIDCQIKTDVEKAIKEINPVNTHHVTFRNGNGTGVTTTAGRSDVTYSIDKQLITETAH